MAAVLLCSVDQPRPPLMFEWSSEGSVQPGETLTISLGAELDEQQYTCRVSNPVSLETVTFTAKDCYTGRISLVICNVGSATKNAPTVSALIKDSLTFGTAVCNGVSPSVSVSNTGLSVGMVVVIVLVILMICVVLLTLVYVLKRRG